ncbi:uncharacterized protein K460DRAFT_402556 [Cucurbitaria berberidis CBS 394.84]|uniref:Uncharacterized protein n=1 Tax=Cucurbitaria berberidis CBS 394.84 TaxID=1168544 RepID=A0A9P4LAB6_9PLEO|nr:uncharacterized protein K460DRAFT_402556 [Cucurbitaria berberidis CBS 394.84]KAF1847192.1 hypothetical protein K460DRAFT_402556 [Cucurbitaria berberidis CBS 394.84]
MPALALPPTGPGSRPNSTKYTPAGDPPLLSCPYHNPILQLQATMNTLAGMQPMEKFLAASSSQHPVAFTEALQIGTAASAGCTCGSVLDAVVHGLAYDAMNLCNTIDTIQESSGDSVLADAVPP